jgi:hypothetical protein
MLTSSHGSVHVEGPSGWTQRGHGNGQTPHRSQPPTPSARAVAGFLPSLLLWLCLTVLGAFAVPIGLWLGHHAAAAAPTLTAMLLVAGIMVAGCLGYTAAPQRQG